MHELDAVVPGLLVGVMLVRVGEHDLLDPVAGVGAQPHAYHAAHRQAAPVHFLDAEAVGDRERVAAEHVHRVGPFGRRTRRGRGGRSAPAGSAVTTAAWSSHICRLVPSEFDSISTGAFAVLRPRHGSGSRPEWIWALFPRIAGIGLQRCCNAAWAWRWAGRGFCFGAHSVHQGARPVLGGHDKGWVRSAEAADQVAAAGSGSGPPAPAAWPLSAVRPWAARLQRAQAAACST